MFYTLLILFNASSFAMRYLLNSLNTKTYNYTNNYIYSEMTAPLFPMHICCLMSRLTVAIMPRDSMPDSKFTIMQRLRDMNTQLAAIDQMSNNIEREFKNTRLVGCLKAHKHRVCGPEVFRHTSTVNFLWQISPCFTIELCRKIV